MEGVNWVISGKMSVTFGREFFGWTWHFKSVMFRVIATAYPRNQYAAVHKSSLKWGNQDRTPIDQALKASAHLFFPGSTPIHHLESLAHANIYFRFIVNDKSKAKQEVPERFATWFSAGNGAKELEKQFNGIRNFQRPDSHHRHLQAIGRPSAAFIHQKSIKNRSNAA